MEPLLSICCTTYNHEKYIRETLDGFLAQQTNFPIEIIVHDDASTDNTAEIIREYALKDSRIVPIDRKSTRLNSSHVRISYAVFCLKKKKDKITKTLR